MSKNTKKIIKCDQTQNVWRYNMIFSGFRCCGFLSWADYPIRFLENALIEILITFAETKRYNI